MIQVLVTGGFGYIGSHFVIKLINNGYLPIIIDNKNNSNIIKNIKKLKRSNLVYYPYV